MSALRTFRILRPVALSIIALGMAQAGTITIPQGSITVTGVVTPTGPLFQYNYTVADTTGELAVLDIAVTPGISITGLAAPGGPPAFATAYDPVLGLVSFLENNSAFTATPLSGFTFISSVAPSASTFGVTLFDGTTGSGSVQGPVVVAAPEPASRTLGVLGAAALLFWRKRALNHRRG